MSHPAAPSFEEDVTVNAESDAMDAVVKDIRHPGAPIMADFGCQMHIEDVAIPTDENGNARSNR